MPEGPEVEVVRIGLQDVIGKTIAKVKISDNKKYVNQKKQLNQLKSSIITKIERKGKFLLWFFSKSGVNHAALNHLGMTGAWHLYSADTWNSFDSPFEQFKHYKLYFYFTNGYHLLFSDVRTFGQFKMYDPNLIREVKSISTLGPDILELPFQNDLFIKKMRGKHNNRTIEIGKALLNPKIVAGCGNIYKSEALFLAKINPFKTVNLVSDEELSKLGDALSKVGQLALKNKGTTLRDYTHVDGYSGLMQNELLIYGRKEGNCSICNSLITAAKQGDRTTYWCTNCQK
ncbi:MAG: bifunctional DNA-formamidopyrimidine glycosylase/DNA-(apurinic or apyrimidinic site) lyase [Candidatus Heimdallarchaeota archaeon]|nr:bifunctional DNA-formamidopyrimidine glycosylase/DNA-(apurinic or apyrimidinic site) lyase [Candidatus Heimdallarchaeota archaeon]